MDMEAALYMDRKSYSEPKKNAELCAKHDVEYWEGLAQVRRWSGKEARELEDKIDHLEATVAAKEIVIKHLKDILADREPDKPAPLKIGRKPIPDDQKNRIRAYRRKGWTIKAIAEHEDLSIGAVSQICHGIKKPKLQ